MPSIGSRIQRRPVVPSVGRLLLAEHAVARERLRQPLAQEPLGVAVGGRHRRAVALALDLEVGGAEPAQRPLAGRAQQRDRGVERLLIDRRPGHAPSLAPASPARRYRGGACA